MMYRMKANGMGLASIAVMCTAVIIILGSTMSIYSGIEGVVDSRISRDYSITYGDEIGDDVSENELKNIEKSMHDLVLSTVEDKSDIRNLNTRKHSEIPMLKLGDTQIGRAHV